MPFAFSRRGFRRIGEVADRPTVTKTQVEYRKGDEEYEHACKFCTMWKPPHSCTFVQGKIDPLGVCDAFVRK